MHGACTICVLLTLITLYACARGKAIGSIVIAIVIVVVDTKFAISGDLGTYIIYKLQVQQIYGINFGEILPLVCLECAFCSST